MRIIPHAPVNMSLYTFTRCVEIRLYTFTRCVEIRLYTLTRCVEIRLYILSQDVSKFVHIIILHGLSIFVYFRLFVYLPLYFYNIIASRYLFIYPFICLYSFTGMSKHIDYIIPQVMSRFA